MGILEPGSTIADFRVRSVLHSGESTTTYLAEQDALDRTVALVVCTAASDSEPGARFVATARRLAAFEHPNVLPVYEVGQSAAGAFAAMREPGDRSVEEIVRHGAVSPARAIEIAERVAAALRALDAARVGPVELAPSHVFVSDAGDVQIDALDAALPGSSAARSDASVARLLTTMVSADDETLGPVLARAAGLDSEELIAQARVALQHRRRLPMALLAGAGVAVAAVAVAVLLLAGGDDGHGPAASPRASAEAPVARLVATIALNETPGSTAVGAGAVWVATQEGNVMRVDPHANRVVGAPIRFAPRDLHNNVTVRTGAGAVFAFDGNRGRIVRIDPASGRVTTRRTLGGLIGGATIADGLIWVLHWDSPRGRPPVDELVRLDASTLRSVGRPASIGRPMGLGPQADDVEVADGVAWVSNTFDGTIMRFDAATGTSTTIRVGTSAVDSALVGGTLWVPDVWSGSLTPVDARAMRLPEASARVDYPFSVAAAGDALWVVAQTGYAGPGGPSRLYRVDPGSRAVLGRPVDIGSDIGWVAAGAGAIWVRSPPKHELLKYVPTTPAPAPRRETRISSSPTQAVAGPLRPGRWATRDFGVPFTFSIGEPGWVMLADHPEAVSLGPADDPLAGFTVYAPRQAFAPSGDVERLRSPGQAAQLVAANPRLRVSARRQTRLGGVMATEVTVAVRAARGQPRFCSSPCALLYPLPASTAGVEAAAPSRLWFLRHGGRVVVVIASVDAHRPDPGRIDALLRTVRFR